jgi:hypothetical protein
MLRRRGRGARHLVRRGAGLSSPGGGGFLLAHATGREPRVLDFFAQTPGRCPDSAQPGADTAAEPLDFLPLEVDFGVATQEFHVGRAAAAVPGMIPGLCAMVEALGTLPLDRVLEPAIRCARRGEALAPMQAHIIAVIGPILTLTAEARAVSAIPRRTRRRSGGRDPAPARPCGHAGTAGEGGRARVSRRPDRQRDGQPVPRGRFAARGRSEPLPRGLARPPAPPGFR